MPGKDILIAEDDAIIAMNIKKILQQKGYSISGVISSGDDLIKAAEEQNPSLILIDIILDGETDGITAAREIQYKHDIPIIYMTAHSDNETLNRAKSTEPYGYILKPISENELYSTIEIAFYKHEVKARLKESEDKFRKLYENAPLAYQILDKDGVLIDVNSTWLAMLGFSRIDVIGQPFSKLIAPEYSDIFQKKFEILKDTGELSTLEMMIIKKNGDPLAVLFHGSVLYDNNEEFKQAHCLFQDITRQRETEKDIKQKNEELEMTNEQLQAALEEMENSNEELLSTNNMLSSLQKELEQKEYMLTSIFRAAPTAIGVVSKRIIKLSNMKMHEMTGYTEEELKEQNARMLYPSDEEYEFVGKEKYRQISEKGTGTVETKWKRKDGSLIDVLLSSTPINPQKLEEGVTFTALDITDRKRYQMELQNERDLLSLINETSPSGITVVNSKGRIIFANASAEKILGLEKNKITDRTYNDPGWKIKAIDGGDFIEEDLPFVRVMKTGEAVFDIEHAIEWPDGRRVMLSINAAPLLSKKGKIDGMVAVVEDITGRKTSEINLISSLREKEILIKEIHHRVKNNMQVISSLLNLQSDYIKDEADLDLFRQSQARVRSMALVHEKLYKSEDLSRVNFADYISELSNYLFTSNNINPDLIKTDIDSTDIYLGIDNAIPCALIINELVSNALKHAFPDNTSGKIEIKFNKNNEQYFLIISDNGRGIPGNIDTSSPATLGIELVNALVKQLKGDIKYQIGNGTRIQIVFPIEG